MTKNVTQLTPVEYMAFLSYSHADNVDEDQQWASWLHQELEEYEIPQDLVGTRNLRGDLIPEKLYPVFRDEVSLSANASLSKVIVEALDRSRSMIVICSPQAVKSQYVADEISHFKASGKADRIVAAIIQGEPNASAQTGKSDVSPGEQSHECFPEPLRFESDSNGKPIHSRRAEPIAADFRLPNGGKGVTNSEALRRQLLLDGNSRDGARKLTIRYEEKSNNALLKIVAGVLDLPLEDLTERDKVAQAIRLHTEKRRKRRVVALILLLLFSVMVGAHMWIRWQQSQNEKLMAESRRLAAIAGQAIHEGKTEHAILLALNALPGAYGGTRPWSVRAAERLYTAITLHQKQKVRKFRHNGPVTSAEFSPDGKLVATASADQTVGIWESISGNVVGLFNHSNEVSQAIFSPGGTRLATLAHTESVARIWNIADQSIEKTLTFYEESTGLGISRIIFSPDGKRIAAGAFDEVKVFDVVTGSPVAKLKHEKGINKSFVFSPDGSQLLTTSWDKTAVVWDIGSETKVASFVHEDKVTYAVFSPSGENIVSVSGKKAILWNVASEKMIESFKHDHEIENASFSANGRLLVTHGTSFPANYAVVWDMVNQTRIGDFEQGIRSPGDFFSSSGEQLLTVVGKEVRVSNIYDKTIPISILEHTDFIEDARFSADGRFVITASGETATVWSLEKRTDSGVLQHLAEVVYSQVCSDGRLVVTASKDKKASVWELASGRQLFSAAHENEYRAPDFSPDCTKVMTSPAENVVVVWNIAGSTEDSVFKAETNIIDAWFSPDGARVASTTWNWDDHTGKVIIFDILTGSEVMSLDGKNEVANLVRSGDGTHALTTEVFNGDVVVWNLASGSTVATFESDQNVSSRVLSWDGKLQLIVSGSKATIWNNKTGTEIARIESAKPIFRSEFSPDGSKVLTVLFDEALVWASESGKRLATLRHESAGTFGSGEAISFATFSPDSSQIVTTSSDDIGVLWDINSESRIATFTHDSWVVHAAFSPDGSHVVTSSSDRETKIWNIVGRRSLVKLGIETLPVGQTCLTLSERTEFGLAALTNKQMVERGCAQYRVQ